MFKRAILFFFGVVLLAGCRKETMIPACAQGYTGKNCSVEVKSNYLGTFYGIEPCTATNEGHHSITITDDADDITKLYFFNLWDAGHINYGVISADGNVYIPSQTIGSDNIIGKAMIIGGSLKVSFTVPFRDSFGEHSDNCVWQQQ
jgi:hypothetical protein